MKYRLVFGAAFGTLFVACAVGTADDAAGVDPSSTPDVDGGSLADGGADKAASSDAGGGGDTGSGGSSGGAPDAAPQKDAGADAAPQGDAATSYGCVGTVDFESGAGGYTHAPMDGYATDTSWPYDVWANGVGGNGLGCHSGTSCFATGLTENYVQCGRAELKSPAIDLSTCAAAPIVKLVFQHAYSFWTGFYNGTTWYDGGIVEISGDGGSTWQAAPGVATTGTLAINPSRGINYACNQNAFHANGKAGFVGASAGWQSVEIVVPAALRTSQFRVRFAYASGVSFATTDPATSRLHTAAGWHVDDVQIVAQ